MATTVRRAISGGLNVRSTAAGAIMVTLNGGDLMYDIEGVSKVVAELNGSTHIWAKVHYYHSSTEPATEGEGWVSTANAIIISTTSPSVSDTFFSNSHLNQREMLTNARYIYNYLKNKGWSSNAIYAMLGNMEAESSINPGAYNGFASPSSNRAYGLVQWYKPSKLWDWLEDNNLSDTITNQLARINYESNNELQWDKNLHSPTMTFAQYKTSSKSCRDLAEYFLRCYEHPGNETSKAPTRKANAEKWATLIGFLVN